MVDETASWQNGILPMKLIISVICLLVIKMPWKPTERNCFIEMVNETASWQNDMTPVPVIYVY